MRAFSARGCATKVEGLKENYRALVDEVHGVKLEPPPARGRTASPRCWCRSAATAGAAGEVLGAFVNMLGAVFIALGRVAARPKRFRFTSMVHQLDNVGWRGVPIILLITFLVGAIIAQQGIFHFSKFGADIYVVDLVGILVLRELGVLVVCIMVAGRSGSAYTAELGSMKMREEIDALRTMGFDPIEVLILPRILALVIARADPDLPGLAGRALRRPAGVLALWRHRSRHFHRTGCTRRSRSTISRSASSRRRSWRW